MGGIAGSLALHGVIAVAAVALVTPSGDAPHEAAITIFVDPALPPVASASEVSRVREPEPQKDEPQKDEPQKDEPRQEAAASAAPASPEPVLHEAVPEPPTYESLAPPDFQPPPRPPQSKPEPSRPEPPKPAPKRATPSPPAPPRSTAPAEAAAPGQAVPAPAAAAPSVAVAPGWNALLAAWLAAHRRYPDESRRRHEEGEVSVRFIVAADGRVTDVALVKGSGFAALDGAALAMLRGAALPPPGIETTRVVRVRYRLSD